MKEGSPSMTPVRVLGAIASAGLPSASLILLAGLGRDSSAISPPIFTAPELVVAQSVCAIPLGWIVAGLIRGRWPGIRPWVCAGAGLSSIGLAWWLGPNLVASMDALGAGFVARGVARSLVATLLVVPWVLAMVGPGLGRTGPVGRSLAIVAALLVAVLPPMALAHRLIGSRALGFLGDRETGRLVRAWKSIEVLRELGAGPLTTGESVASARVTLAGDLRQLARSVRDAPGDPRSTADRIGLAFALIGLDRFDRSEAVLRPLIEVDHPDALLLLAAIERDRGHWDRSARLSERVIAGQLPLVSGDRSALDRCVTAYDGLIDARFGGDRPAEAGLLIREALARLPARKAHFTLRLGRYELEAGRGSVALGLFGEAARLDPSLTPEVRPLIQSVRVKTPACLVGH